MMLKAIFLLALVAVSHAFFFKLGGGQRPRGHNRPSYGDHQPTYGDHQPSHGDHQPSHGDLQPSYGYLQPGYGYQQPGYGHDYDYELGRHNGYNNYNNVYDDGSYGQH